MPGQHYFDSIVNFWRVFSGHTPAAAEACRDFLSKVINTKDYPLTQLGNTTASETAKVLENSYRASTIAFIDEWGKFAENVGVDLFEVIDAIRIRPTHSNMRQPGFGVGGYCLTKDPLLAAIGARDLLGIPNLDFPVSTRAVEINQRMPLGTLDRLEKCLPGGVSGKKILLLGVSYRSDVGDTRFSPSQIFFEEAKRRGAEVTPQDPLVEHWPELDLRVQQDLPNPANFDAIVFAVAHEEYRGLDICSWLGTHRAFVMDANRVLSSEQLNSLAENGYPHASMGRGNHKELRKS